MKKAEWIWLDKKAQADEYAAFYDVFDASAADGAKIKISVAGDYNLYVNGRLAAFGQYPDYQNYKVYDEVDVSAFLRDGKNELHLLAWYVGESFSTYKEGGVGAIFELCNAKGDVLSYSKAGLRCSLAKGYVSHRKKVITPQLGFSYTYDTRPSEYRWQAAVEVQGFGKELIQRPNQKLGFGPFKKATLLDDQKRIYDLGEEACGFLRLCFCAPQGERIQVTFGEHITDGEVRAQIGIRDFSVDFIGNGTLVEFIGSFRRLGCRYLQVLGNATVEEIGLMETNYPLVEKPFAVDDALRNRIYQTSLRTLRLCLHEHYEDCPWREQSMYIMDTRNQILCGYYAFDNQECAESAIRLMSKGQKANGLFELCFPADVPITIPCFSLAFATVVLEYVQRYNDLAFAAEMLPCVEKALGYFLSRTDGDGMFKTVTEEGIWHFYEWAGDLDGNFFSENQQEKQRCGYDSLINAFLSIALSKTATLCQALGQVERAEEYLAIKQRLNEKIKEKFFVEESGLFKTYDDGVVYSELANALCVLAGVPTQAEAEQICQALISPNTEWVKSTLSMACFRYDALILVNKDKYQDFILRDIDEIYGYMLDQGATTFWETIKGEADFDGAGSLCHGWSALPVYYYHLLG